MRGQHVASNKSLTSDCSLYLQNLAIRLESDRQNAINKADKKSDKLFSKLYPPDPVLSAMTGMKLKASSEVYNKYKKNITEKLQDTELARSAKELVDLLLGVKGSEAMIVIAAISGYYLRQRLKKILQENNINFKWLVEQWEQYNLELTCILRAKELRDSETHLEALKEKRNKIVIGHDCRKIKKECDKEIKQVECSLKNMKKSLYVGSFEQLQSEFENYKLTIQLLQSSQSDVNVLISNLDKCYIDIKNVFTNEVNIFYESLKEKIINDFRNKYSESTRDIVSHEDMLLFHKKIIYCYFDFSQLYSRKMKIQHITFGLLIRQELFYECLKYMRLMVMSNWEITKKNIFSFLRKNKRFNTISVYDKEAKEIHELLFTDNEQVSGKLRKIQCNYSNSVTLREQFISCEKFSSPVILLLHLLVYNVIFPTLRISFITQGIAEFHLYFYTISIVKNMLKKNSKFLPCMTTATVFYLAKCLFVCILKSVYNDAEYNKRQFMGSIEEKYNADPLSTMILLTPAFVLIESVLVTLMDKLHCAIQERLKKNIHEVQNNRYVYKYTGSFFGKENSGYIDQFNPTRPDRVRFSVS